MKPKRPRDTNQLAKMIVDLSVRETTDPDPLAGKDVAAVERGKLGGRKGGRARAEARVRIALEDQRRQRRDVRLPVRTVLRRRVGQHARQPIPLAGAIATGKVAGLKARARHRRPPTAWRPHPLRTKLSLGS